MRKSISIFSILLLLAVFTFSVQSFSINVSYEYHMSDISDHWSREYINELVYMGILKGYNQNAKPDSRITRAEFISLLVRALNIEDYSQKSKKYFKDVEVSDWYYAPIAAAYENGIIIGYGDGTFLPEKNISREEIVITTVKALRVDERYLGDVKNFKDIDNNYLYKNELSAAVQAGVIKGYSDNTFRPKNHALRSEAAVIIRKMLDVETYTLDILEQEKFIVDLINNYVNQYLAKKNNGQYDINFNIEYSIGKAREDNLTRSEIIKYFNQKNYRVLESKKNSDVNVEEISGSVAKARMIYDVNYTRQFFDGSKRSKNYKGDKIFSLRKINDSWKIYNIEERLFQDYKINMVWDQISVRTPDMSGVAPMEGLNVISPTWFELRKSDNKLGVKASDPVVFRNEQGNIHIVDMGDVNYMNWAHHNGYDVWGLFRNEFDIDIANKVLNSEESRRHMIKLLLEYTWKYKLDGINVDFENIYFSDRYVLSQFIRELALVLREQGLITSVDVTKIEPGSWNWSMCYDRRALGEAVDYVALMAYDQNGSWSKQSGSVAQINWVERSLTEVLEQVRAEKMLLGLPFYTVLWEEQNGKVVKTSAISMETSQNLIRQNNAHVVWDNFSGQYIATYKKGNSTFKIWVEDARSIELKASLVNKYGLAGVASWRRGFETPDIWYTISRSLK
ncbi:UNVERIFIED_CONTAM: putative glycosyl hydrolase [Acetivibrio alkalicellulosi]